MASILFDCDSTLFKIESLEVLLDPLLSTGDTKDAIREITSQGMAGEIPFFTSLKERLEIAEPNMDDVLRFNDLIADYISDDAEELIVFLLEEGHHVYLVSGGLKEVIAALAKHVGLPEENVYAVSLEWDKDGRFHSVSEEDLMSHSKVDGLEGEVDEFDPPIIVIGDGMTDARLKDAGIADLFIAYIEHAQRTSVIEKADYVVSNMLELGDLLEELLC